jgi:hypothetical protein
MKRLLIKDVIEFRGKTDRSKKSFSSNLKIDPEKSKMEGGGDYWVSCLSAISNYFKLNDVNLINDKIYELEGKLEAHEDKRIRTMYERNISILYGFENFDFTLWKPSEKMTFLKKHKPDFLQSIKGLQLKATPQHVFSYKSEGVYFVGAIWFVAKLGGYRKDELGMFTDILYRYLINIFSKNYELAPKYCIAVDTVNKNFVSYKELLEGNVPFLLDKTIDEIKKLM